MRRKKRRQIVVTLTLSVAPGVTVREAKREVKTRTNDACCYSLNEEDVRVVRTSAPPGRR